MKNSKNSNSLEKNLLFFLHFINVKERKVKKIYKIEFEILYINICIRGKIDQNKYKSCRNIEKCQIYLLNYIQLKYNWNTVWIISE